MSAPAKSHRRSSVEICPSCGAITPFSSTGVTHRYLESSPGCWAAYGEVLAREYSDAARMSVHALTVDAYSAQHPGCESPQTISSINLHLASLYAYFEDAMPMSDLGSLKSRLAAHKSEFAWLEPPEKLGRITVTVILETDDAQAHCESVEQWARCVFDAWASHHDRVRAMLRGLA